MRSFIGGLVGCSSATVSVDDCHNTGEVIGEWDVGGLIGYAYNLKITNSYNEGIVTATALDGKTFAGGFVGYAGGEFSNILNSYNNGNVSGSGLCVGGIIGEGYCDSAELINLYNTGNITSTTSGGEVGGMIGYFNESKAKLENCYNMGNIDNKAYYSGGMVGNTNSNTEKWSHCYNSGNVYAKGGNAGGIIGYGYYQELNECHNTGDITVPEEKNNSSYVGELVGGSTSKTFVNCTFLKKTTNANDNGATPKEDMTETMSIQNFATLMNSYVTTNNTDSTKTHLKTWKLENGLPVFAE